MLVLSRKEGESIQIGNNVFVKVLRVQGDRVRLGIDAPRNVSVMRSELHKDHYEYEVETEGNTSAEGAFASIIELTIPRDADSLEATSFVEGSPSS